VNDAFMDSIERTLEDFRAVIANADATTPSVSEWRVGMHIHHCALSMIGISKSLRKSTPPMPRAKPSLSRSVTLTCGFIPRGRAKTPSFIVPSATVAQAELASLLDEAEKLMAVAQALDRDRWFTHPLLGPMGRDDAFKFIRIHNRHHLRIVADILRAARS
jgi:hypothetical protein